VDQHGGQEHDRSVQVQHRGHAGNQPKQRQQQHARRKRRERDPVSQRLKKTIRARRLTDQKQARHEHERRPGLLGRIEYDRETNHTSQFTVLN
jgi:hypothetical protein